MAVTDLHLLHSVTHDATQIPGINRVSMNTGGQLRADGGCAKVYPEFVGLVDQSANAQFDTTALSVALGLCGLSGTDVGSTTNGIIFWEKKLTDGGGIAAGSVHRKIAAKDGLLVLRSLAVSERGDAVLSYELLVTYDGVNAPYVITGSQSLPAVAANTERYGLGPVKIGNVTISQVASYTLDFGVNVEVTQADGDIYPTFAAITRIAPSLTVRGKNATWLDSSAIPLAGLACTHANTIFYCRRRSSGGGYVADNQSSHVKCTMAGMAQITTAFDANGVDAGEAAIEVRGTYDGSNAPVVVATGQQIT